MRYTTRDLDGLPGVHHFDVMELYVGIPGYGGGRDGPTTPDSPAQEAWMRAHSGLREVWYLCWDLPDEAARRQFLERIGHG